MEKSNSKTPITILGILVLLTPAITVIVNESLASNVFKIYAIGIVIGSIAISIWSDILKDVFINNETQSQTKTYSFSRVQGMWWTVIISFCYTWAYAENGTKSIIELNSTCLTLLGIGVGTTLIGSLIDNNDTSSGKQRYQDTITSKGFFWDILCDGKTVTVHRFQALIFNIIFAVVFLVKFFEKYSFPDFNATTLGLLGISTSAYLTMKATSENNNNKKDTSINSIQVRKDTLEASE